MQAVIKTLMPVLCLAWALAGCGGPEPAAGPTVSTSPTEPARTQPPDRPPSPVATPGGVSPEVAVAQRQRFADHVGDSYDATVETGCFCANAAIPLRIEVRDGILTRATRTAADGTIMDVTDQLGDYPVRTVDGIHADIVEATGNPRSVVTTIEYDDRGVPTIVSIDRRKDAVDDEVRYVVGGVVAVPSGSPMPPRVAPGSSHARMPTGPRATDR